MAGIAGRSGPKIGNLNAAKNGSRVNRHRLVVGDLPKELISVRREGQAYRRALEAMVMQAKNEVGLTDAHLIDTASAATIAAGISRWLLRHRLDTMSVSDIRGCSQDIVKAKERRDAAVRALGLDVPPPEMDLHTYLEIKSKPAAIEAADEDEDGGSITNRINLGGHDLGDK